MPINTVDELHAATEKGKIASAKEVFLTGDKENLQQIGEKTHQLEDSIKNIAATGGASTAAAVTFDNASSGMTAVNVQGAIEELNTKNKAQDTELSKKANAIDVNTKINEEKSRVDGELNKKLAKTNITQELGESEEKVVSQKCVKNTIDGMNTNISKIENAVEEVESAKYFGTSHITHENTPARNDLSIDSAKNMKGYKCNLSGLFDAGIKYVYFTGAYYTSSSTVVGGLIIDNKGEIESKTDIENKSYLKKYWFKLPITANSKTLWASYISDETHPEFWNPIVVYFTNKIQEDKFSEIDDKLNYFESKVTLKLNGQGTSGIGFITKVGDRYYNTTFKVIKECTAYEDKEHFTTKDISPSISALYLIGNILYIWNENELQPIIQEIGSLNTRLESFDRQLLDFQQETESINTMTGIQKTFELYGNIIQLISSYKIVSIPDDLIIYTNNVLDQDTIVTGKIINDNGLEVEDSSSYYSYKIPVLGQTSLAANFLIQRIYYYSITGEFLGRKIFQKQVVPIETTLNGKTVGWVQIQVQNPTLVNNKIVVYGTKIPTEYTKFKSNKTGQIYSPSCYCVKSDLSTIRLDIKDSKGFSITAIEIPNVWEPTNVDTKYSSPINRNNVKREEWEAENKYFYYDFIKAYYDKYIGYTKDGYSVKKRSLGNDCSREGYEIFEYEFTPRNFTKTVLLSAGMNTCETGAIWGLATFIKELIASDEAGMKFLHDNIRFKVIPIMCPYSFDQSPLLYLNKNGVRINKNFNYKNSWSIISGSGNPKGEYPDSEAETKIIKKWINDNSFRANLWIDCHQDPDYSEDTTKWLTGVFCSDINTENKIKKCFESILQFYKNKGYCNKSHTVDTNMRLSIEGGNVYPKTKYSFEVCGIPALMVEQYCSSSLYGSDGQHINDEAGIKNYVLELRLYIYAVLECTTEVKNLNTFAHSSYILEYQ